MVVPSLQLTVAESGKPCGDAFPPVPLVVLVVVAPLAVVELVVVAPLAVVELVVVAPPAVVELVLVTPLAVVELVVLVLVVAPSVAAPPLPPSGTGSSS